MFILLNIRPKKSIPIEAIEYDAQTSHWIDAHQRNKIQTLTLSFHVFKGHMNEFISLFFYFIICCYRMRARTSQTYQNGIGKRATATTIFD